MWRRMTFSAIVHTGPGVKPASCPMGNCSFFRVNAAWVYSRPSHSSRAWVVDRLELYLYSVSGTSSSFGGWILSSFAFCLQTTFVLLFNYYWATAPVVLLLSYSTCCIVTELQHLLYFYWATAPLVLLLSYSTCCIVTEFRGNFVEANSFMSGWLTAIY